MSDRDQFEQWNDIGDESLDEIIRSAKQDLAGIGAEESQTEPLRTPFEPKLPLEYADLELDDEVLDASAEPTGGRPRSRVLWYVIFVLLTSAIIAIAAWICADDILALTREDETVLVTVNEGDSIAKVASTLKEAGLIRYPFLFKLYAGLSHAQNKIDPGTYRLNGTYDYHALVDGMISTYGNRATVDVTIPEGYECEDIFKLLTDSGVCTQEELHETAANYDFDFAFLEDIPSNTDNRLEGYLFPDTYEFYVGDIPERVISKFLQNFESKITEDMRLAVGNLNEELAGEMRQNGFSEAEIQQNELSFHDIVIVASLIEKESAKPSESPSIAAVIYNRLCSKQYPYLNIDATLQYALAERKETLSNADKLIESPYNTYINVGLPVGPIASPGTSSIRAALHPANSYNYFYALGGDGVHHFFETYEEHLAFLDDQSDAG